MRPALDRTPSHLLRSGALALAAVLIAACGSAGSATASLPPAVTDSPAPASVQPSPTSPSPTPTVAPSKGPATAQFALTGTAGLTGQVTITEIICDQPTFDGRQISVFGKSGTSGPQFVLFLTAGHAEVRVGTGSGASLKLRTFVGSGVTNFDGATGAQLDTKLTESTAAGTATGDLGALSAISGTIDCGDQQPGTSNVVISGTSSLGALAGAMTGVHVMCTVVASGTYVGIQGLGMAGTTPVILLVTASVGMLQVAVETRTAGSFYTGKGAAYTTLVPGGATLAGDVTESVTGGATPHVLHLAGDATCGVTLHP